MKLNPNNDRSAAPNLTGANMSSTLKAPPIGHPWPGQGGTYAGLCRGRDGQADYHLILADIRPKAAYLSWLAGMAWAKTVTVDGHTDFDLPTRYESPILFGNVGALFEREWHWTARSPPSTTPSSRASATAPSTATARRQSSECEPSADCRSILQSFPPRPRTPPRLQHEPARTRPR